MEEGIWSEYWPVQDVAQEMDLEAALAKIPEEYRSPLLLSLEGYTLTEIGEALGISHVAVHKRIQNGLKLLRGLMSPSDQSC